QLIQELNLTLASSSDHAAKIKTLNRPEEKIAYATDCLSSKAKETFALLSQEIQLQLLLDRDPHGNVQVSKIETERLFIYLASKEMKRLGVPFSGQPIFCGYEGRSCLPSNFDCNYCYSLGKLALLLIARGHTGYIVSLQHLASPVRDWQAAVTPLISLLHLEERDGKQKPVIAKALVDLAAAPFTLFASKREAWRLDDQYCQVGPMQFFGPPELQNDPPLTLQLR
ncbi:MAG: diphosphate--fructose-6-phosphate 1-phosphotransferase, partial [Verrucomicrobia bacterium]|nr:diphosphate--fructose-6-phosphate 1-phosphotransferase [Verrucomicrobiota bacterium]